MEGEIQELRDFVAQLQAENESWRQKRERETMKMATRTIKSTNSERYSYAELPSAKLVSASRSHHLPSLSAAGSHCLGMRWGTRPSTHTTFTDQPAVPPLPNVGKLKPAVLKSHSSGRREVGSHWLWGGFR